MILIDKKAEATSSSSLLNLSTEKEKATLSFGELLKGVTLKKDDKLIQNGALVLSLEGDKNESKDSAKPLKNETLLSLLKTTAKEKAEPLELHPKLVENLSVKEIKTLIAGAKEYLKDKILSSDEYKNAQLKELPKTLKGLATLAQKIGVDISKITIEEVQAKTAFKESPKVETKEALKSQLVQGNQDKETPKPQIAQNVKEKETPKPQIAQNVKEKETPKPQIAQNV
ncbi:MAG: flagellar hook-length control protein FliK, partial [Campylobacterota bacterium]|nr:flagellar hook-length control protein FliK [Campylobacterota bacterium]